MKKKFSIFNKIQKWLGKCNTKPTRYIVEEDLYEVFYKFDWIDKHERLLFLMKALQKRINRV